MNHPRVASASVNEAKEKFCEAKEKKDREKERGKEGRKEGGKERGGRGKRGGELEAYSCTRESIMQERGSASTRPYLRRVILRAREKKARRVGGESADGDYRETKSSHPRSRAKCSLNDGLRTWIMGDARLAI